MKTLYSLRNLLFFLLMPLLANAQQEAHLSVTSFNGQPEITATNSITLKPGFQATGVRIYTVGGMPRMRSTPSFGKNFVMTKKFYRSGVNNANLGQDRNADDVQIEIKYLDDLGRLEQGVSVMNSPSYYDVVQVMEYDRFGREIKSYLPYSDNTELNGIFKNNGKITQSKFYSSSSSWDNHVVKTDYPYSETVIRSRPEVQIDETSSPGAIWRKGNNHTVRMRYGSNKSSGLDVVKLWKATSSGASSVGNYSQGYLFRTTTCDENWVNTGTSTSPSRAGSTDEYKNKNGQIVLRRTWQGENPSDALDTYYIYDYLGNLRYVIPPGFTGSLFTENDINFKNYIYAYKYDGNRNVIEKKIPGKDWQWLVYNGINQVILTQDGLQRIKKQWSYTKYDAFARIASTGLYTNETLNQTTRQQLQTLALANPILWESRIGTTNYSNLSFPNTQSQLTELVVNYYDDYTFKISTLLPITGGLDSTTLVKGALTGTKIYKDDGTSPLMTVNYYDIRSRIIETVSQNQLNGVERVTNDYDFTGQLLASKRQHSVSGSSVLTTILTTNLYDHSGRIIETRKKLNSQAEVSQSKLSYNDIGQLKQKNLHNVGNTAAQEINYTYNERGWLKSLNNPAAVTPKRVFGMELSYGDKADSYNGNISSMKWNTEVTSTMTMQPMQIYTYSYDKLNRLRKGGYINNATSSPANKAGYYDEELSYDMMGNIDTLRRRNGTVSSWYNNFKYTYNGNQLNQVADAGTAARANSFTYDVNGNVITNLRRGITNIDYNHLNLPVRLVKGSENLLYSYDGQGKKLTKTLGSATTQYIDGIQYKSGVLEFIQTEEGRILPNGSSFIYEYFLKDHLDNTRAVVDHNGIIKQIQDYYPFGMEMNQGNALNMASNLYKYNGKEKQSEFGLDYLDYGARFYDPEIGRFTVSDPVADNFPWMTNYQYASNSPVSKLDLDGFEGIFFFRAPIAFGNSSVTPRIGPLARGASVENLAKAGGEIGGKPVQELVGRAVEATKNPQDHHTIPRQFKENEVIRLAREEGFKFEGNENRIPIERYSKSTGEGRHGNHPNYNKEVLGRLQKFSKDNPDFKGPDALKFTRNLVKDLKQIIENNPGTKVNDLFNSTFIQKALAPVVSQDNTKTKSKVLPEIKPKIDPDLYL